VGAEITLVGEFCSNSSYTYEPNRQPTLHEWLMFWYTISNFFDRRIVQNYFFQSCSSLWGIKAEFCDQGGFQVEGDMTNKNDKKHPYRLVGGFK